MISQLKWIICIGLIVSFLSSSSIAFALDDPGSELIWQIGVNEAPPDYTEKAFDEFDNIPPFNSNYSADTEPCTKFPQEINDGEFTQIYIHYNLTSEQANKNLRLFLDTLLATHVSELGRISDYNMRIKVKPPNKNWIEIGEFKFASSPPYGDGPEERYITIDNSYVETGENIILLENANPKWSQHWLMWDSLKLEVADIAPLYFESTKNRMKIGEEAIFSLSAVNANGNPKINATLILKTPSKVSVTGPFFREYGGGVYGRVYIVNPGDEKSFPILIQANEEGEYEVKAEIDYKFEGEDKIYTQYETLKLIVEPLPTPTLPSETAFKLAPSVNLTSTKTTIEAEDPAILTLSMINPMVNEVDLTVQSILKVSSGVHITAASFSASGSNQFTGTFKVRPGEENHITIQVTSEEVGPKIIDSQIIYYPGESKSNFSQLQQTMSIIAKEKSITIPTPPPGETPAPTPRVPGFEVIFAIAGLLAVAYLVGRRK